MDAPESLRMISSFGMHLRLNPSARIFLLRWGAVRSGGLWYLLWKRTSTAPSTFHACRRSMRKFTGEQMMYAPKAATTSERKPFREHGSEDTYQQNLQLALGTFSFTVCFAAWGLISAFAPRFREEFHLSATQTAFLIAVPVLLGALLRIATGMLADRFGGRAVFALLMIVVAAPAYIVPMVANYRMLLYVALFLGMAGSSFAAGMGFVSRWFPPERQGGALGIYGLGHIGQSAAVFLGPVLAVAVGWQNIFRGVAVLLVIWGIAFFLFARNSPKTVRPLSVRAMLQLLSRERLSWVLSLFYFLTFGGFVAFSIYLPVLLKDQFGLKPADAGFRTAGFVVLATLARPLGGWLADKIGGARVLQAVFLGIIPFALLLVWPSMLPFTVGALGCAFLLGNGNGAVFKLVPQYFPKQVGTVTGLVGAMGGLGGFFPPLLLGFFRDRLHAIWPGFALLAFFSAVLWRTHAVVFLGQQL